MNSVMALPVKHPEKQHEMILELLARGHAMEFATIGNSMWPLIDADSRVTVRGCPIEHLRFGDVVLLAQPTMHGKYVVHRIVQVSRADGGVLIFTKGDSSPRDIQAYGEKTCIGVVELITTGSRRYDLGKWYWRPLRILVGGLSRISAYFTDGFLLYRKKDFRKQLYPQRLANSLLRRIVRFGKWLSSRNAPAEPADHR